MQLFLLKLTKSTSTYQTLLFLTYSIKETVTQNLLTKILSELTFMLQKLNQLMLKNGPKFTTRRQRKPHPWKDPMPQKLQETSSIKFSSLLKMYQLLWTTIHTEFFSTLMMDLVLTSLMELLQITFTRTTNQERNLRNIPNFWLNSTHGLMQWLKREMDSTSSRILRSSIEFEFE